TKRHILVYAVILALAGLSPAFCGMATPAYGVIAALLGALFVALAWQVFRMPESDTVMRPARRLFAFSMFYLFMLFAVLLVEHGIPGAGFGQ
ncbi:MAG: protoheme IX farnesyltransferase, partial [Bauldia sp.]